MSLHQVLQAFDREGQVRAAFITQHGVNLIYDQGADTGQHGSATGTTQEQVKRLRRRHQDVGRISGHFLPYRSRRVAGAHGNSDIYWCFAAEV